MIEVVENQYSKSCFSNSNAESLSKSHSKNHLIKTYLNNIIVNKYYSKQNFRFLFKNENLQACQPLSTKAFRRKLELILYNFINLSNFIYIKRKINRKPISRTTFWLVDSKGVQEKYVITRYYQQLKKDIDRFHFPRGRPSYEKMAILSKGRKSLQIRREECDLFEDDILSLIQDGKYETENLREVGVFNNKFWDTWLTGEDCNLKNINTECYRLIIHPAIVETVKQLFKASPRTFSILELGGGSGELAKSILSIYNSRISEYVILEKNKMLIKKAKERLHDQATVISFDIEKEKLPSKSESVKLVVGSGILTFDVLPLKFKQKHFLKNLYTILEPGGMVILSGLSKSLFYKRDFKSKGFEVLNCSLPTFPTHLYILKKPEHASNEINKKRPNRFSHRRLEKNIT